MNEEQKENDNLINNFKSLAPNDNADDIDIYKPYIDKILKDSNNKNIAISGRYGAGKSSIIKTYFKDKKVIYVSLASYIEKNQSEEIFNNGKNLTEKNKMKRIENKLKIFFEPSLSIPLIVALMWQSDEICTAVKDHNRPFQIRFFPLDLICTSETIQNILSSV